MTKKTDVIKALIRQETPEFEEPFEVLSFFNWKTTLTTLDRCVDGRVDEFLEEDYIVTDEKYGETIVGYRYSPPTGAPEETIANVALLQHEKHVDSKQAATFRALVSSSLRSRERDYLDTDALTELRKAGLVQRGNREMGFNAFLDAIESYYQNTEKWETLIDVYMNTDAVPGGEKQEGAILTVAADEEVQDAKMRHQLRGNGVMDYLTGQ